MKFKTLREQVKTLALKNEMLRIKNHDLATGLLYYAIEKNHEWSDKGKLAQKILGVDNKGVKI